ncbi:MAG TPA: hypothetical protein VLC91_06855 [Spongiibacteraceae bacterium]|nr:hypothetical protein [Spongiibacteraceae bacterium]
MSELLDGVDRFRQLDWRDTTLHNMRCKGGAMNFLMTQHPDGAARDKLELVSIAITGLTYLSVSLAAYRDGRYGAFEKPVTLGNNSGGQLLEFEGKMQKNPFSNTVGDSFWVAIDFIAATIEVQRTGRFIEASTLNFPNA